MSSSCCVLLFYSKVEVLRRLIADRPFEIDDPREHRFLKSKVMFRTPNHPLNHYLLPW